MCIAILQKKDSPLTSDQLTNCWRSNNDGVGYSFIKDNRLQSKHFLEFYSFENEYKTDYAAEGKKSKFMVHFRYATHGTVDLQNVHPFKVNEDLHFCHNGIIDNVQISKKVSDTRIFNRNILQRYHHNFLKDSKLMKKIKRKYLKGSKLVFLNQNNEHHIVNEDRGMWNKGIWFSNDGYKAKTFNLKTYSDSYGHYDSYYGSTYCDECAEEYSQDSIIQIKFFDQFGKRTHLNLCFFCVQDVLDREHIDYANDDHDPNKEFTL